MEPVPQSRIPARSRRQTMDWALVLASQGIFATIEDDAEGAGWGLVVDAADYPAALRAIRLYRQENSHWRWRQPIPWPGLFFDWRVLGWGGLLMAFHWLTWRVRPDLPMAGRMDNAAVSAGEWWRIFSAMLLHADAGHLAANVSLGLILLGLTMGRFGGGVGLLAAYLAGAGGNVAGRLVYPATHLGVGASGMVMGALGLLAIQSLPRLRRHATGRKQLLQGILGGLMLFALFGLSPEADVIAHLGGFVTGLLLGGILMQLPAGRQSSRINLLAWWLLGGLLVTTSWLAFR